MKRDSGELALSYLERIRSLELRSRTKVMNVCGGHERTITQAGLRNVLPDGVELIPGPGCPVCICPEEDIYHAIQIARQPRVILAAFGDMLRVPVNAPKREPRSLEQAKAAGADVRPIASPLEAKRLATESPDRDVVFFAAGFETTMAPVAAMLAEGVPANLWLLLSGRLTWPAVAMLLESGRPGFDALIAPGHVATVMGPEEWEFVSRDHALPTAIAGFEPASLLAATYAVLRQLVDGECRLVNCYPQAVRNGGNARARQILTRCFDIVAADWRGIGTIPASGFALNDHFAAHDARARESWMTDPAARKRAGEMPPGCDCARVVLGRIYPNECQLYGRACTPRHPIGPCMVSDEGACRVWWAGGIRESVTTERPAAKAV
ncbi:MAG: hydrogenase formation protein HypD [Gammaproteobacteria bacterium]|nr:hydrogenase formation protein HypD [Gammaproteobacteria bacterium]